MPYFDCAPPGIFSQQLAGHIFRRTQGYVGDTALLLTEALLAAFDDGSDTITTANCAAYRMAASPAASSGATASPQLSASSVRLPCRARKWIPAAMIAILK